ncbi:hypothetical protein ACP70R_037842 [Stipagrostis hirtigluma subsp. patula]
MAASPETALPPDTESIDMHPSPPPASSPIPPPTKESTSPTTGAPPDAAHPDHATPTLKPPLEHRTEEHSEADDPPGPPPPPIDRADSPPSLPPHLEAAPAESTALEAASPEKPASPSPRPPDEAAEAIPEVAAASAQLPPPSPQIEEALPEDALQPSPPTAPPATTSSASADSFTTTAVAMASQEAAPPPPSPESVEADSLTAPAPLTPPLESGPEGLLLQQPPRPQFPEMAPPVSEKLPDTGADEVTAAAGSPPALQATDRETNDTPGVPLASESAAEVSLPEPMQTSSSPGMEAEPCSPEMAPPGFENFKSQWLPLPPPTPPAGFTDSMVEGAASNALAVGMMPVAAAGSMPALEAMDISPGQQPPLKSVAAGQLQQPLLGSYSPTTEAAPCSPDMPPPGFENFKSWLTPPPAETTYSLTDVTAANPVELTFVEKACSVPALEATNVETDTAQSLLPPLQSGAGGSSQGPLTRSPSPVIQAAPCSPDMGPPGFENPKLLQLQLPQTASRLQDSATTCALYVTTEETPRPSPALETMDILMDAASALPPSSESGSGESLPQEPPQLPSGTACSPEIVPSGSENVESSQPLPPALVLPLVQAPDTLADAVAKEAAPVEEVHHPQSVAGPVEESKGTILPPPPLEKGCLGPSPHLEPQASSPTSQAASTSPEIAPAGPTSLHLAETLDPCPQTPTTKPVIVESEKTVQLPSSFRDADTDLASSTELQSPSKSGERLLLQQQHQPSSPSVQDAPCPPEMAPPGYENLDSSEQLPPPPPLCTNFEIGQMVCGYSYCRRLLAYPKGAVHVQCVGCGTINLVLEEHQVGKAHCGQCETLLMYPFGAPAVRCSNCLFVTEIGERNVRRRISMEQSTSPNQQELTQPNLVSPSRVQSCNLDVPCNAGEAAVENL